MASQNYITSADIKGNVFQDFNLSAVVDEANNHLESLAISVNCGVDEIAYPVNPLVKEYLVSFACRQCALQKIGTNNVELSQDKYIVLHSTYNKEVERLRQYLNYETLTDNLYNANETSKTTLIYRC